MLKTADDHDAELLEKQAAELADSTSIIQEKVKQQLSFMTDAKGLDVSSIQQVMQLVGELHSEHPPLGTIVSLFRSNVEALYDDTDLRKWDRFNVDAFLSNKTELEQLQAMTRFAEASVREVDAAYADKVS